MGNNLPENILYLWFKLHPRSCVKFLYYINTGKQLDWNKIQTFNEKIQWIKVYGITEDKRKCADKLTARDYVSQCGLDRILPKIYKVFHSENQLDIDVLPSPVVFKRTLGWNTNYIWNRDMDSIGLDIFLDKAFHESFGIYTAEAQYFEKNHRILCEEYLAGDGRELIEYKFFCFHGIPRYMQVDTDRYGDHRRNLYDSDSNLMDLRLGFENIELQLPSPDKLEEMKTIAQTLSKPFDFVRVDLFLVGEAVYFNELTFTPSAGYKSFDPEKYDAEFGDLLCIN